LVPTLAWGFFILYLTLAPKGANDTTLPKWILQLQPDKWVHFVLFFIWYVLFYKYYFILKGSTGAIGKMDFYFLSLFTAILIEILQMNMGWGRSADIFDILADMAGFFIALVWSGQKIFCSPSFFLLSFSVPIF
jgi:hypothetical protein